MFKLVLDDYKNQAWSALKHVWNTGNWFIYLYMCILPPLQFKLDNYEAYVYYSAVIPMIVGLLLSRMYPNRISKTLLLCPMTPEERKRYILTGFKLRIYGSLLLYLVCTVPLLIMNMLRFTYFIVMFLLLMLFVVSVNIYCNPTVNAPGALDREYDLPGYYPIWDVLVQIVGILGMDVLTIIQRTQKNLFENKVAVVVVGFILVIEFGLFMKMVRTYYKPIMEQAIYYDTSYGKEKRNEVNR